MTLTPKVTTIAPVTTNSQPHVLVTRFVEFTVSGSVQCPPGGQGSLTASGSGEFTVDVGVFVDTLVGKPPETLIVPMFVSLGSVTVTAKDVRQPTPYRLVASISPGASIEVTLRALVTFDEAGRSASYGELPAFAATAAQSYHKDIDAPWVFVS